MVFQYLPLNFLSDDTWNYSAFAEFFIPDTAERDVVELAENLPLSIVNGILSMQPEQGTHNVPMWGKLRKQQYRVTEGYKLS